jgi:hypothetical protein
MSLNDFSRGWQSVVYADNDAMKALQRGFA